jgi:hypothetical protein
MRWWCTILAVMLAWIAYGASPYLALYRLSRAVQTRDVEAVEQRVNFRTLRVSLTKQAMAAALDAVAVRRDLSNRDRQILTDAAGALAEPLVESLVTPKTLIDLLDDGSTGLLSPDRAAPQAEAEEPQGQGNPADGPAEPAHQGLRAASLGQLFALFRWRAASDCVCACAAGPGGWSISNCRRTCANASARR